MVSSDDLKKNDAKYARNKTIVDELMSHSEKTYTRDDVESMITVSMNYIEEEVEQYNYNLISLGTSTVFFTLFGLGEYFASVESNSLCLFADSMNCIIDSLTYAIAFYLEYFKLTNKGVELSYYTLWIMNIFIPFVSVIVLIVFMSFVMYDSINILRDPPLVSDVDINYIFLCAGINLLVDVICVGTFIHGMVSGKDLFEEEVQLNATIQNTAPAPAVTKNTHISSTGSTRSSSSSITYQNSDLGEMQDKESQYIQQVIGRIRAGSIRSRDRHSKVEGTKEDHAYYVTQQVKEKNYNMISAAIHLLGDFMNALAEMMAAIVSKVSGINPNICDAAAAVFSASLITLLSLFVLYDLILAHDRLIKTKYNILEDAIYQILSDDLD